MYIYIYIYAESGRKEERGRIGKLHWGELNVIMKVHVDYWEQKRGGGEGKLGRTLKKNSKIHKRK
jgi:hypothetical protein